MVKKKKNNKFKHNISSDAFLFCLCLQVNNQMSRCEQHQKGRQVEEAREKGFFNLQTEKI